MPSDYSTMGANIQSPPAYPSPGTPNHQQAGGHGHIAMYPQTSAMNSNYRMSMTIAPDKRMLELMHSNYNHLYSIVN